MVRVISVHHFTSQDVAPVASRPLASTIAGNSLLVSTVNQTAIQVRDLRKCAKLSHCVQTIDTATQIVYSEQGNCVLTLEGESPGSTIRAYTNWDNSRVDGAPIRPRIAGRVGPSQAISDDHIDMIEFPQREVPLRIGVCQSTGNMAVAAANVIQIYKMVVKTHETSKAKYLDFEDCIHVFHTFPNPKEIQLAEDVVGCLSDTEVHVFKVKFNDGQHRDDSGGLRSISLYSVSSEVSSVSSDHHLDPLSSLFLDASAGGGGGGGGGSVSGSDEGSVKVVDGANTLRVTNVTAKRQRDSEANDVHLDGYKGDVKRHPGHVYFDPGVVKKVVLPEVDRANRDLLSGGTGTTPRIMEQDLGPVRLCQSSPNDMIVKLVPTMSSAEQDFMVEVEAVSLVHCKLTKSEEPHEMFKNLVLKPVYWGELKMRAAAAASSSVANPLQSKFNQHLMSLTLLFTSKNEGYLYHLPGHLRKAGKGCGVQRVATYPFTGPVSQVAIEPTVLHALTHTGLETYTLRSGYYTVLEAERLTNRTNACPGTDVPICLVGLRPFLGAKQLHVSGDHLVLLSSVGDAYVAAKPDQPEEVDNESWTIYSLTLPSSLSLHSDMIQLANMNRTLSPHGYFQLLCEAHIVLRTSCHQLTWSQSNQETASATREKFLENCLLLANYYFMQPNPKEWKLALPYFRMSENSPVDILKQAESIWKEKCEDATQGADSLPMGLVHYINEMVLRPSVREDVQESKLADAIIELLGRYSVHNLSLLVLKSPAFMQFKAGKTRGFLRRNLESGLPTTAASAETAVAFSLLTLEMGEAGVPDLESARSFLQSVPALQMSEVLILHHSFLLDEGDDMFSEFAVLVRDSCQDTFVEVLTSLIKTGRLSLNHVLNMFISSFVSSNLSHQSFGIKECSATHNTAMLQLFLETYFTELLADAEETKAMVVLDPDQTQALHTLIRSYLTSLTVPVRFVERNIDSNLYVTRRVYLEMLPPFDASSDEKETDMLNTDSPDFWCQNSLLKLQSLLCCSALCRDLTPHHIVKSFLDVKPDTIGALSLRVLCNEMENCQEENIELMADNFPETLLPYAKEARFGLAHWRALLKALQDRLSNEEHLKHEAWYATMHEVLDHLAQVLTLDAFLSVLPTPNPQDAEDFQGHIQMCRKNQQAHQIQSLIVTTGHKLLSTLTF